MFRWTPRIALLVVLLASAGCGAHHPPPATNKVLPPSVKHACPEATHLQGSMGACSPERTATP